MPPWPILAEILATLPTGWQGRQLWLGQNWTISVVENSAASAGQRQAGLAATPSVRDMTGQTRFQFGVNQSVPADALELAQLVQSADPVAAAVGLATLNALLKPDPALLSPIDAADWLVQHGRQKGVALVGRFPFIEELQPVAAKLWVLELDPRPGEFPASQAPQILPQADVIAITSSTLINQTLAGLLALIPPQTAVMLLGPSTPLSPILLNHGIDLLSGVQIDDVDQVLAAVMAGVTFQRLSGVKRVTMQRA